jgi:hypothetical protein
MYISHSLSNNFCTVYPFCYKNSILLYFILRWYLYFYLCIFCTTYISYKLCRLPINKPLTFPVPTMLTWTIISRFDVFTLVKSLRNTFFVYQFYVIAYYCLEMCSDIHGLVVLVDWLIDWLIDCSIHNWVYIYIYINCIHYLYNTIMIIVTYAMVILITKYLCVTMACISNSQ